MATYNSSCLLMLCTIASLMRCIEESAKIPIRSMWKIFLHVSATRNVSVSVPKWHISSLNDYYTEVDVFVLCCQKRGC
jgi:hypothetical protein